MSILRTIWAFWGVLVFAILMFPALPFYIIAIAIWKQKAILKVHWVSRAWATGIFLFCGIRTKRIGSKKLNRNQSYVLVSNHQSALDIPLCAVASPNPFRFLSKAELGKIPVLGWIIRNIYLTVDRGNAQARLRSMTRMQEAMNEGSSLFIYPEGTRNRGTDLTTKFYDGAFRLALTSGKPLGILVILNAGKLCPAKGAYLSPGVLKYTWLDPIPTEGMGIEQLETLKKRTKELIEDTLKAHQ